MGAAWVVGLKFVAVSGHRSAVSSAWPSRLGVKAQAGQCEQGQGQRGRAEARSGGAVPGEQTVGFPATAGLLGEVALGLVT